MIKNIFLTSTCLLSMVLPSVVKARLTVLSGGVTTGLDWSETRYKNEETSNETVNSSNSYTKDFFIGPDFTLESNSSIDQISINYRPQYTYDFETEDSTFRYSSCSLSGHRDLSRRFRLEIGDNFHYSNDPDLIQTDNSSDYNRGRRVYWVNNFNIDSSYNYDEGSSLSSGYAYNIMRHKDTGPGGYEDYDRHILDLGVDHRFNTSWRGEITASYTRGLFDPPDQRIIEGVTEGLESVSAGITDNIDTSEQSNDLSEYHGSAALDWNISTRKTAQAFYSYSGTDYDSTLRFDSDIHNLTFGGQYRHTTRLSFALGGGPSYEKTDTFDPNWGYNANFNISYDLSQHSSFSTSFNKGYSQENFSSNNTAFGRDQGFTDFWHCRVNYSHQFLQALNMELYASYRDEKQEDIINLLTAAPDNTNILNEDREAIRDQSSFSRNIYTAGTRLRYTFLQYWTTGLNYSYRKQDSERINDSYDEHRVYLTLSVQKELFRW